MMKDLPETDDEWRQLKERKIKEKRRADRKMRNKEKVEFRYVLLLAVAVFAFIKVIIFPYWDSVEVARRQRLEDAIERSKRACIDGGGDPSDDGVTCHGLRHKLENYGN